MEPIEMIEFLKRESKLGNVRVEDSYGIYEISHTCNDTVIYFWAGGCYASYNNHDENNSSYQGLLKRLTQVNRIEKYMDKQYYPIWTKEDGLITQTESFVILNGRYYTIKFLEQLLDKITDFKKINI